MHYQYRSRTVRNEDGLNRIVTSRTWCVNQGTVRNPMLTIDWHVRPADLWPAMGRMWRLSALKLRSLRRTFRPGQGAPVFTVRGQYASRGWTDWTEGFQFGSELLQFDATGEKKFLHAAREQILAHMAPHLTHFGVHDHGFNNASTFGQLLRLMNEKRIPENPWERRTYELALKVSGAVQARRWTNLPDGGYIYSFNGPHSLFIDTIRSLRVLALSHQLGGVLAEENDRRISLLERLVIHARTTAKFNICGTDGPGVYARRGAVRQEVIFNINDGAFRCPSSQQGFSPFTTWTRGLAWAMCGFAEQLEFLRAIPAEALRRCGGKSAVTSFMLQAARATCDFYLENTPTDGVPYWDTGAPELYRLGQYLDRPAEPFNPYEPVDSSAAAIAVQGLLRLGRYLDGTLGRRYFQAALTILRTLLNEPYLSVERQHQGLLLHSVYHRPNGWDYIPPGRRVPCGEASMWGDYHLREAAWCVQRLAQGQPDLMFWRKPT